MKEEGHMLSNVSGCSLAERLHERILNIKLLKASVMDAFESRADIVISETYQFNLCFTHLI